MEISIINPLTKTHTLKRVVVSVEDPLILVAVTLSSHLDCTAHSRNIVAP